MADFFYKYNSKHYISGVTEEIRNKKTKKKNKKQKKPHSNCFLFF